jgi:hypothetical protein
MPTTKNQRQEAYIDPEDYPRWWNWDEDGDVCAGTYVRFTQGFSELVGHDDLMTTARTYTHVVADEREVDLASLLPQDR